MSPLGRCVASLLLLVAPTLLGIGASLTPNPTGVGTHQQLGLPPCSFLKITGILCPQCGLTTSFALLARGQLNAAFSANPAGPALAIILLTASPWLLISLVHKRWVASADPASLLLKITLAWFLLTLLQWIPRIL
jgi:hypothetical protein